MDAAVQWARDMGYDRVCLNVHRQNLAAIRLYVRKGFVRTVPDASVEEGEDRYAMPL